MSILAGVERQKSENRQGAGTREEQAMSNYVFSFRNQSDRKVSPEEEAAWGQWFQEISSTVVDFGHRVGRVRVLDESATPAGAGRKDGQEVLSGYIVVRADDLDGAAAMAKGCPGLQHGGRVEVAETVDM
jgi:hypothetical protein